jgi:ribulose-5-phosphate 4-epimerase/fuculose-1-phosphate aldolase
VPEPVHEGPVVNGDVMTDADRARVELAMVFRAAVMHGFHEGIDNHFSLAVPGEPGRFLLNPYGAHWSELRASDLLVVDEAGHVVGDGEAESSAFFIHSRLHLARPDAACVLHTHMPYATALALTETGFETRLSQNSVRFHGRYALIPGYGGLVNDAVEGDRLAEAVADGVRVVLLANHGVLVIGESLAHAWEDLYFFERACMVQVLAQSTGEPLRLMDVDVAELTVKQYDGERFKAEILLAATRRLVDRELPGYEA